MILEKQLNGSSSQSVTMQRDVCVPPVHDDPTSNGPDEDQDDSYYIAKVSPLNSIEGLLLHTRSFIFNWCQSMLEEPMICYPLQFARKHVPPYGL